MQTMITVVSGLPRSGTSLMMQMLKAGGMPVLADDVRQSDEDNPRGYYEYAPVKQIEQDNSWLGHAEDKAVKVVSPLLKCLPTSFEYRIVLLYRDLDEVLQSQEKMLKRQGMPIGTDTATMQDYFEKHLRTVREWLAEQQNMLYIECRFADLFVHPSREVARISRFLARDFDKPAMIQSIQPELRRQRNQ